MSEATLETHRAESANRRKSVYGDGVAAAALKMRDSISTGVKSAQDTVVNKLSVPGEEAADSMPRSPSSGRRGSCVNLLALNAAVAKSKEQAEPVKVE